jgi:hypothetical protein
MNKVESKKRNMAQNFWKICQKTCPYGTTGDLADQT